MKALIAIMTAALILIACQTQMATTNGASGLNAGTSPKAATSTKIVSLREGNNLYNIAATFPNRKIKVEDGGIEVSFDDQPPMIPHEVKDETMTLTKNDCLTCHSKKGAKENEDGAAKAPKSHFRTRDGKKTTKIAARRYFCTQCHYTQQDKAPIVKNNYFNPENE